MSGGKCYHVIHCNSVDSDYSRTVLNITLRGNGDEMMQIMIPIVDDNRVEDTEYFTLNFDVIADSGNIRLYQPNVTTIQIFDVDGKGRLLWSTSSSEPGGIDNDYNICSLFSSAYSCYN